MKTQKLPNMMLAALVVAVTLNACGKTKRASDGAATASSAPAAAGAPDLGGGTTNPPPLSTSTFTNTNTGTTGNEPPYSFSMDLQGGQAGITPQIKTDNVLKVKFQVGTHQGNQYHSASELAVTLTLNGVSNFQPKYTTNNYTYGQVGETSNVIDLSSYITPGVPLQITIKNPQNDFYCTYAPNPFYYWDGAQWAPTNPLYNSYPGCRRAVYSNHYWSGTLIVQTSATTPI